MTDTVQAWIVEKLAGITPARKKITVMACEDLTPQPPLLQGEGEQEACGEA